MTRFCSDRVTHRTRPRLGPQVEGRDSDIIPAAGGFPGSGFVSKVGSFLASAEDNEQADTVVRDITQEVESIGLKRNRIVPLIPRAAHSTRRLRLSGGSGLLWSSAQQ